tara:strand:+ start:528 stop:1004 length:477 start_codon:yes stop_codon:yes gene_type:complete
MISLSGISDQNSKLLVEALIETTATQDCTILGTRELEYGDIEFVYTMAILDLIPACIENKKGFSVSVTFPQRKDESFALGWREGVLDFGLQVYDLNGELIPRELEIRDELARSDAWAQFVQIAETLSEQTIEVFWVDQEEEAELIYSGSIRTIGELVL